MFDMPMKGEVGFGIPLPEEGRVVVFVRDDGALCLKRADGSITSMKGATGVDGAPGTSAFVLTDTRIGVQTAFGATEEVVKQLLVPANTLALGDTIEIQAGGAHTNTTTATVSTTRVRIGNSGLTGPVAQSTQFAAGTVAKTGVTQFVEARLTVTAVGAAGGVVGFISENLGYPSTVTPVPGVGALAINTAIDNLVSLTFASGGAASSRTFSFCRIAVRRGS